MTRAAVRRPWPEDPVADLPGLHYTVVTVVAGTSMRFEWDERKNERNRRKHRVSFDEAQTVFFDDNAVLYDDPDHSIDEERFLLLGVSSRLRVLVVVHVLREGGEVIRIVSARRATRLERREYQRGKT